MMVEDPGNDNGAKDGESPLVNAMVMVMVMVVVMVMVMVTVMVMVMVMVTMVDFSTDRVEHGLRPSVFHLRSDTLKEHFTHHFISRTICICPDDTDNNRLHYE